MTNLGIIRCGCCPNAVDCLASRLDAPPDEVLKNPSSEHCLVARYGDAVVKFIKPRGARLVERYADIAAYTQRWPQWFARTIFDPVTMTLRQAFIRGRFATLDESNGLLAQHGDHPDTRPIIDAGGKNVITTPAGRVLVIDFGFCGSRLRRRPLAPRGRVQP